MDSIVIDRAGKQFGKVWAIRDVSLEVRRGEVLGVYGRTGSGKTALLGLISGLDSPTVGDVSLQSPRDGDKSWLSARISIAMQKPGLAPELTVNENLRLASTLWGIAGRSRTSRVAMFMELLGISDLRNRRISTLADGQKAAVELARALVARADVTVIDGLLDRLDRPVRRRLWEYIQACKRQGSTFVIGTASASEAELCDRVGVLWRGRLRFVATPSELKAAAKNEMVVVESLHNPLLKSKLRKRFGAAVVERNGEIEFKSRDADGDAARVLSELGSDVGCVYVRPTTLDDALDRIEGD